MTVPNVTNVCADLNHWKSIPELLNCTPGGPYMHMTLLSVFAALLFYILTRTADEYLCSSLVEVSKSLNMSQSLAGVTLVAFGNGAPDLFSAVSAIRSSRSSMVFAQLYGSGAFVSALVAGIVMIVVPSFTVEWTTFTRNISFFLGGAAFTFYVFYRRTIHLVHAAGFVVIYITYIIIVAASSACQSAEVTMKHDEEEAMESSSMKSVDTFTDSGVSSLSSHSAVENPSRSIIQDFVEHALPWSLSEFEGMSWFSKIGNIISLPVNLSLRLTIPVLDKAAPDANWCKALNTIHCVVTPPITVLLFTGDLWVYGVPLSVSTLPVSIILGIVVLCTSSVERAPKYHMAFALLGFVASAAWIFRTCEILVETLSAIGATLRIPESIMGLTVLSWGNSLGDLVTNIAIAKHGYASMAMSAAFGGILLDMLLGLGLPYTYILLSTGKRAIALEWSNAVVPLFAGVVSFIVVAGGGLWFNKWRTSKLHGCIFISIYATTVIASSIVAMEESVNGLT